MVLTELYQNYRISRRHFRYYLEQSQCTEYSVHTMQSDLQHY